MNIMTLELLLLRLSMKKRKSYHLTSKSIWLSQEMASFITFKEKLLFLQFLSGKEKWDCIKRLKRSSSSKNTLPGRHFLLGRHLFDEKWFLTQVTSWTKNFSFLMTNCQNLYLKFEKRLWRFRKWICLKSKENLTTGHEL